MDQQKYLKLSDEEKAKLRNHGALSGKSQTTGSVSDVLQMIDEAQDLVCDLSERKKRWTMSVPVDEKNDTDCVLMRALTEAKTLIEKQNDNHQPERA